MHFQVFLEKPLTCTWLVLRLFKKKPLDLGVDALSQGVKVEQATTSAQQDPTLKEIYSAKGTIRGKRRGVRAKLEVFTQQGQLLQDPVMAKLLEVRPGINGIH